MPSSNGACPCRHGVGSRGQGDFRDVLCSTTAAPSASPAWSAVVVGTPSLWCPISNALPKRLVKIALSRSRTAPLHIIYHTGRWPKSAIPDDRFVPRICKHASRWEKVDFASDSEDDFIRFARLRLHNVKYLGLESLRKDGAPLAITLQDVPQLLHLCVTGLNFRWGQDSTQHGLKELQLLRSKTSCRGLLSTLADSPDLESLELRNVSTFDIPTEEEIRPLHFRRLTSTTLVALNQKLLRLLFPSTHVPPDGYYWISCTSEDWGPTFTDLDRSILEWTREQLPEIVTLTIWLKPSQQGPPMVRSFDLSGQTPSVIHRNLTYRSTTLRFTPRHLQAVLDEVLGLCSSDEWAKMVSVVVLEDPIDWGCLDLRALGKLLPTVDTIIARGSSIFAPLMEQLGPPSMQEESSWIVPFPSLRPLAALNIDEAKLKSVVSVLRWYNRRAGAFSRQHPFECFSINGITPDALESDNFQDLVRFLHPGIVEVAHRYDAVDQSIGEAFTHAFARTAEWRWVTMTEVPHA